MVQIPLGEGRLHQLGTEITDTSFTVNVIFSQNKACSNTYTCAQEELAFNSGCTAIAQGPYTAELLGYSI